MPAQFIIDRRGWLTIAAGAGFSGCGVRSERPTQLRTLRVGVSQTISAMTTLSLGEELGHFREAGLAVEPTVTGSGATLIPSLVAGSLDLYIGSLSPAFLTPNVLRSGVRVAMARDSVKPGCSTWGSIYGLKRSFPGGLTDLRELKGKKIAFSNRGAISEYGLDLLLRAGGLQEGEAEGVALRQAEALGALAAGQLDGVFSTSLWADNAGNLAEKAALFPGIARVAPGFQYSFILFGAALRGPERKAGQAFLRAFLRGSRDFVKGKTPKDFDAIAKRNGLDPVSARSSCRDTALPGGVVDVEQVQRYADWALRKKYIDTAVNARDAVDTALLTEAGIADAGV